MSDPFAYKVKFTDIRVKPPQSDTSRARARQTRECEHKGCDLAGDHKSPKHGGGHLYFCQRHAAQYNKQWNFFDGMTEDEVADFNEKARYGHKETWKFGTGPVGGAKAAAAHDPKRWRGRNLFDDSAAPERPRERKRTRLEARALAELDLDNNATPADIRARYSDYVRRFHPDTNGGDRSSEQKLARVIRAWKTLKAAGLTKG